MCRLLIVDDEVIMREAIKTLVSKYIPEITEIYEAESGREAIELAEKDRPDIICMDIKMPGIDGMDSIKIIKRMLPKAIIIVISAYDEFKTAATVMKYGIKTYLLKPLDREEFNHAMHTAIEEHKRNESSMQDLINLNETVSSLQDVLEDEIVYAFIMGDKERLKKIYGKKYDSFHNGLAIVIKFHADKSQMVLWKPFYDRALSRIKSYIEQYHKGIVSDLHEGKILVFLFDVEPAEVRETTDCLSEILAQSIPDDNTGVTIGVGPVGESMADLQTSYCLASRVADKICEGSITVLQGAEVDTSVEYEYPLAIEKSILQSIEAEDDKAAQVRFVEMFSYISSYADGNQTFIYNGLFLFAGSLLRFRMNKGLGKPSGMMLEYIDDATSLYKWCIFCIEDTVEDLRRMKETHSNQLIDDAIAYIHDHYASPITLDEISGIVSLSSYYFTKLFKAKTRKTFVEYLTDYRIEMAKKLLRENLSLKIKDIGEAVGYPDYKYFCKLFRAKTGITPAGYRGQVE